MDIPPELKEFVPGVAGSLVATPFLKGPWHVRAGMVFGGSALSYYATKPAALYLDMLGSVGFVGFLIGLFGMALVSKAHELIESFNVSELGVALKDYLRAKLGG